MNPIRWLLDLSASLADRSAGRNDPDVHVHAGESVDSREYEAWVEIGQAALLVTNLKAHERWLQMSSSCRRLARVVQEQDSLFRLNVYEVNDHHWRDWEGPALFDSLAEAKEAGQFLLERE